MLGLKQFEKILYTEVFVGEESFKSDSRGDISIGIGTRLNTRLNTGACRS